MKKDFCRLLKIPIVCSKVKLGYILILEPEFVPIGILIATDY